MPVRSVENSVPSSPNFEIFMLIFEKKKNG